MHPLRAEVEARQREAGLQREEAQRREAGEPRGRLEVAVAQQREVARQREVGVPLAQPLHLHHTPLRSEAARQRI